MFAGHLVDEKVLLQQLEVHRRLHQKKLATYQNIYKDCYSHVEKLPKEELLKYLVLRRGIRNETEWIEWCEETMDMLQCQNH
jgi:hypothetical protein